MTSPSVSPGLQGTPHLSIFYSKTSSLPRFGANDYFFTSTESTEHRTVGGGCLFLRFCLFLERVEGTEKEISMLHTPYWGPGWQPRHVAWLVLEPVTHLFEGRHSIYWATPVRAEELVLFFAKRLGSMKTWVRESRNISSFSFYWSFKVWSSDKREWTKETTGVKERRKVSEGSWSRMGWRIRKTKIGAVMLPLICTCPILSLPLTCSDRSTDAVPEEPGEEGHTQTAF